MSAPTGTLPWGSLQTLRTGPRTVVCAPPRGSGRLALPVACSSDGRAGSFHGPRVSLPLLPLVGCVQSESDTLAGLQIREADVVWSSREGCTASDPSTDSVGRGAVSGGWMWVCLRLSSLPSERMSSIHRLQRVHQHCRQGLFPTVSPCVSSTSILRFFVCLFLWTLFSLFCFVLNMFY